MRVLSGLRQVLQDPVEAYYKASAQWQGRHDRECDRGSYRINEDWRAQLGVSGDDREQTARVCRAIHDTLMQRGIQPGPESFLWWNDGDPAFLQAIWCVIRRLDAKKIVETGVAHGGTSRTILEAMAGQGRLWSIDLPPPMAPEVHANIGIAVGKRPPEWSLIFGSSQRRLPRLLQTIAPIDVFVHDSLHSRFNMLFEMNLAWPALRPGGAMIVDDIDLNTAFAEFSRRVGVTPLVGEAEPVRPDTRRFNHKGLFGILFKPDT